MERQGAGLRVSLLALHFSLIPLVSSQVDPKLVSSISQTFTTMLQSQSPGLTFAKDFGSQKLAKELKILDMSGEELLTAWEACIAAAVSAKLAVNEEAQKAIQAAVCDRTASFYCIRRTHPWPPDRSREADI